MSDEQVLDISALSPPEPCHNEHYFKKQKDNCEACMHQIELMEWSKGADNFASKLNPPGASPPCQVIELYLNVLMWMVEAINRLFKFIINTHPHAIALMNMGCHLVFSYKLINDFLLDEVYYVWDLISHLFRKSNRLTFLTTLSITRVASPISVRNWSVSQPMPRIYRVCNTLLYTLRS